LRGTGLLDIDLITLQLDFGAPWVEKHCALDNGAI